MALRIHTDTYIKAGFSIHSPQNHLIFLIRYVDKSFSLFTFYFHYSTIQWRYGWFTHLHAILIVILFLFVSLLGFCLGIVVKTHWNTEQKLINYTRMVRIWLWIKEHFDMYTARKNKIHLPKTWDLCVSFNDSNSVWMCVLFFCWYFERLYGFLCLQSLNSRGKLNEKDFTGRYELYNII